MDLSPIEIRVLGALLEKQRTTHDAYPLTLNALRLACNQSTNRDPVVDYDESTIKSALERLGRRKWATLASWSTARSVKHKHLLDQALGLDDPQLALMNVLMLRGAQTPGELKQRSERMHEFADLDAVHATLDRLVERGLAARLERRPGQKEDRYTHLMGEGEADAAAAAPQVASPPQPAVAPDGGAHLAERVERLEARVAALERALGD